MSSQLRDDQKVARRGHSGDSRGAVSVLPTSFRACRTRAWKQRDDRHEAASCGDRPCGDTLCRRSRERGCNGRTRKPPLQDHSGDPRMRSKRPRRHACRRTRYARAVVPSDSGAEFPEYVGTTHAATCERQSSRIGPMSPARAKVVYHSAAAWKRGGIR